MIKKLMDELSVLVEDYTRDFKPTDAAEWNVVLSEISTFLEAEKKLTPVDLKGTRVRALKSDYTVSRKPAYGAEPRSDPAHHEIRQGRCAKDEAAGDHPCRQLPEPDKVFRADARHVPHAAEPGTRADHRCHG